MKYAIATLCMFVFVFGQKKDTVKTNIDTTKALQPLGIQVMFDSVMYKGYKFVFPKIKDDNLIVYQMIMFEAVDNKEFAEYLYKIGVTDILINSRDTLKTFRLSGLQRIQDSLLALQQPPQKKKGFNPTGIIIVVLLLAILILALNLIKKNGKKDSEHKET